ncbi:MAG: cyclic nucleotide-binding domain-containing protein [Alphaproteobacteria bacterium]|nr:cyclic nucleotide-binding domain-containing protein [Alphaproteobacteria bacterium]MDP6589492.1 cyclic nucleotide-binding domain-containing protein [Alphaproteobacteria bacterium]MDP6818203.1 cyclic nucleotide-binding domain-containing protein [Alphaproteobacteria bacterium]
MANDTVLERKSVRAGDRIFKEGAEGHNAYLVQSGEIEIIKMIDGNPVVLGTIGSGGIFGEMALIDDQPRMAMARAKVGGTVVIISRKMFAQKLAKADPFIRGLLNILVKNIRTYQ